MKCIKFSKPKFYENISFQSTNRPVFITQKIILQTLEYYTTCITLWNSCWV